MKPRIRLPAGLPWIAALAASAAGIADAQTVAAPPQSPKPFALRDECKDADPDEIVVCGARDDASQYRLPQADRGFDPDGPVESVLRERSRLLEGGEAGIGSCSTVGPGGWTGCMAAEWKRDEQQGRSKTAIGLRVGTPRAD